MSETPYASWDEFKSRVGIFVREIGFPYGIEWTIAIGSGWDHQEYQKLYREYVRSTQIKIGPKDDRAKLKGRPLEKVAHYFLKQGGLVSEISEINEIGKWQVDGYGPANRTSILCCWGKKASTNWSTGLCRRLKIILPL